MESMMDMFQRGGLLMWVLLGFSIVAVAVIAERALVYLRYGLHADAWFERLLGEVRAGRADAALGMAALSPHPVARVAEEYLRNLDRPARTRRDNVGRRGTLVLEGVERHLRLLAAIAHLAPLVGLLGTVTGMVTAFAQIQVLQGAARPADLAGGIWEALLTTVFGLLVAIPSMAAFHGFESHADKIARRMEMAVSALDDLFEGSGEEEAVADSASRDSWTSVG
jgi:biopolymer transport protein ExbB